MTELDIIKHLSSRQDHQKFPYQLPNAYIYGWECDYWTMTAEGECREFEIKISRQDYLKDAHKDKHKTVSGANFFYYVCPKDLIKPDEVDAKYGLLYVWEGGFISVAKKPKRLHNNRFDQWKVLCNKMYWRYRELLKEKWQVKKEITRDQYFETLLLEESDLMPETTTP